MRKNLSKLVLPTLAIFMFSACSGAGNVTQSLDNDVVEASSSSDKELVFAKKDNKTNSGSPSAFTSDEQKKRMDQGIKDLKFPPSKNTPAYNDILKVARQALDDAAASNLQSVAFRYEKVYNPSYLKLIEMNEAKKIKPILAVFDVLKTDAATRLISSPEDSASVIFSLYQIITTFKSDVYNDPQTLLAYVDNTEKYCKEHENRFYVKKFVAIEMVNKYYKGLTKEQKDFVFEYLGNVATINTWKESSEKLTEMFTKLKSQLSKK